MTPNTPPVFGSLGRLAASKRTQPVASNHACGNAKLMKKGTQRHEAAAGRCPT